MALRKIKLGYYAYYRDDKGRQRTISLHTRDAAAAKRLHAQFMETLAAAKTAAAIRSRHPELFPTSTDNNIAKEYNLPEYHPRTNRLKLADMLEVAREHRKLSPRHVDAFNNFCAAVAPRRYADEITPAIALAYLDNAYASGNGKGYNNTLTQLNVIFKACLIRAGMDASPFATVPHRIVEAVAHYRPFTADEFRAIFTTAAEPWKTAALISWHTALRKETCFRLSWADINESDRSLIIMPGKTARFGRAVYVPIHPELWRHLNSLTRPADPSKPILSQFPRLFHYPGYPLLMYFSGLLVSLGIRATAEGQVGFHSLRSSFITRCDEAGISRRATKGVAGHSTDDMTDLYSHDRETAKQILTLPNVLT